MLGQVEAVARSVVASWVVPTHVQRLFGVRCAPPGCAVGLSQTVRKGGGWWLSLVVLGSAKLARRQPMTPNRQAWPGGMHSRDLSLPWRVVGVPALGHQATRGFGGTGKNIG